MDIFQSLEDFNNRKPNESIIVTYQLDNQYMSMTFDTEDKKSLLERMTQEVSDYLHLSLENISSLIDNKIAPEAISLIEAKERDITPHSFYTAFVALWKSEYTDEDFVEILNDLVEEWKFSRLEWIEDLHLSLDDYEEYTLRDKIILNSMIIDSFDFSL